MKLTPVFLDFESYWDKDHTLSKMSPIEYVMSPKTEIISVAIKVGDYPTDVVFGEDKIRHVLNKLDWSNKMAIGHNMSGFDSMILKWRFGIQPAMWGCTAAMARPKYAKTTGVSLKALAKEFGIGAKLDLEATNTKGKYLKDFTPEELDAMSEYNKVDTELCAALFKRLVKGFPKGELALIHLTTQMLVNPKFMLDKGLLEAALSVERANKHKALLDLAKLIREGQSAIEIEWSDEEAVAEFVRSEMASAPRFAKLLESCGVEVPMKPSPTDPTKQVPALAKTDEGFLKLQDHPNPLVASAARTRLSVKSTILETRLEAFLRAGAACGGKLPVPLKYCGADTTGRWSGEQYNCQNLPRIGSKPKTSDALRNSLKAPKGHKVVVADLSGIELRVNHFLWKVQSSMDLYVEDAEADLYRAFAAARYGVKPEEVTKEQRQLAKLCLAEGTLVLTDRGEVPIEQVTASDKVWDGLEWVSTLGPVFKGVKDVIEYDGLVATPDHEVWVEDGRKVPLRYAAAQSLRLARTGDAGVPLGFGGTGVRGDCGSVEPPIRQTQRRVWDLLNCGPRHRFTANGRLVSNCQLGLGFGAGWRTFKRVAKLMGGLDLSDEDAEAVTTAWRTTYHDIVQGWRRCHDALPDILQGTSKLIDPWGMCETELGAIRLPSGRRIYYPALRTEVDTNGKKEWWYGEGRHKARIYAGKITENCLAEGTLVLTDSGWKPIQSVSADDLVHDGVEFVRHAGIVFKSVQGCITLDGVYMTPDHKVLTDDGWQEASQVQRPYRPDIRGVDCAAPGGVHGQVVEVAVSVPVRSADSETGVGRCEGSQARGYAELRLSHKATDFQGQHSARDVKAPGVRCLALYARQVQAAVAQGVQKLRRAWDHGLRAVAGFVRELLGGHGAYVPAWAGLGPGGQRRPVLAGELPVGKQAHQHDEQAQLTARGGCSRTEPEARHQPQHDLLPASARVEPGRPGSHTITEKPVYDIINCGPRHRFVVKGESGPMVVHNCVQALARDVIAGNAIDFWRATRFEPVLMVHDELVYVVPEADAQGALDELQKIMRTPPKWWPELVTWSEGDIADSYGAAK